MIPDFVERGRLQMNKLVAAGVASLVLLSACNSTDDDNEASSSAAPPATDETTGTSAPSETTAPPDSTESSGTGSSETSSPDATAAETTEPAATVAPDPRAPGVTADAVKVGVGYLDLSEIGDVINVDHGDYEAAYQAMFDHINAEGGIHGRQLVPVYSPVNPTGTAGAEAACTKLTQDDPVFVVLGFFQGDDILCYVELNETAALSGEMSAERLERANAPWYSTEPSAELEADAIAVLAEEGRLDGNVGVVALAIEQPLVDAVIAPALDAAGITPAETALIDAPLTDTTAVYAAAATIAERFNAEGVDTVLVVGGAPRRAG